MQGDTKHNQVIEALKELLLANREDRKIAAEVKKDLLRANNEERQRAANDKKNADDEATKAKLAASDAKIDADKASARTGTLLLLRLLCPLALCNCLTGNVSNFACVVLVVYYAFVAFSACTALSDGLSDKSTSVQVVAVVVVIGNLLFQGVDESTLCVQFLCWLLRCIYQEK